VDRALEAAPYAYMLKPINEDQLRVTLETTKKRLRLEKERGELVGQLCQAQKMEAIGQLAAGWRTTSTTYCPSSWATRKWP